MPGTKPSSRGAATLRSTRYVTPEKMWRCGILPRR
jgi:hypothetical protein